MTAIQRKAQRRFLADDEVFAKPGRGCRDNLDRAVGDCAGVIAITALNGAGTPAAIPEIDLELWLLGARIITVADESQLSLIFIPGKFLIFPFTRQQRHRCS